MNSLIAFVGFAHSGKNSAAKILVDNGFLPFSFGDTLKDILAAIFGWPRHLLEGDTPESRLWREQPDPWWTKHLGIPDFSPRRAMELIATDALREHFHKDIFILSLQRKLLSLVHNANVAITDIRFPNEAAMVRAKGGKIYRVRRGPEPVWFSTALSANIGCGASKRMMSEKYFVHESEYAWIGIPLDGTFENNGTLDDLYKTVGSSLIGETQCW